MAKASKPRKLKVFRTPIGFHDAYVAAPSQKAALEAWGTETNLFAGGAAEQVTDPELMKVPLEHPGQVVKVLRGTKAEQLAALAKQKIPARSKAPAAEVLPSRRRKAAPKPSRAALDRAEKSLDKLREQQERQVEALDRQMAELERKRRDMLRRHQRERDQAEERVEEERTAWRDAIDRYESG